MISIHHNGYQIRLIDAGPEDKLVFRNLIQLYQYDMSEFKGADPDRHGLFDYSDLDHYWTRHGREAEGRQAILIKIDEAVAGFAFLNNLALSVPRDDTTRHLAEFFIMRRWRRRHLGKVIVKELFDTYPGVWEVREERENRNAQLFWRNVIQEYTGGGFKEQEFDEHAWKGPVQSFDNRGRL
ncbi:acetyltransferase [Paenibacillus sp. IB182496]|uniref:Acetyltransferase n=1 Tax=Paenibacillus sabuli TaxID=2772509 RepID=A0A927BRK4_9BACL|nr:GNAT family N-acetyltransferase [Paenibacillus sabuli]MBD2844987.1 acetyltransferase [Paenibacillus sabuli]